jgi:ankyrin repeat protein
MSAIPLHLAAFDGDNDTVNRLLTEGANVDALTNDAETPLLFAAMNGHTAAVRTLLKWGASVNLLPAQGESALRQATKGGHAEVVRLLLAKEADPNAEVPARTLTEEEKASSQEKMRETAEKLRQMAVSLGAGDTSLPDMLANLGAEDADEKSKTPKYPGEYQCLIHAIRSRSFGTLKVLLEAGYSPLPSPGPKLPSLLEMAKTIGTGLDMARLLLEHGADPNGNEEDSLTPLQNAVMLGDLPYARLLMEFGAKTESREQGMSLLTYAAMRETREMVEFLLDHSIGVYDDQAEFFARSQNRPDLAELIRQKRGTAWLSLVKAGDVEGVRTALQNGADLDATLKWDGSALMIATENSNTAMVRLLLEAGADPNQCKAHSDLVPVHIAATKGAKDIVRVLVEHRADIHAQTSFGQTAVNRAAFAGHADLMDLLVDKGARISVIEAILLRRFDVANDLWATGTPINYRNESGTSALHAAVAIKDVELISSLISRGAEVDATDRSDQTPLLFAIGSDDVELVRLLLDNGADPRGNGKTFHTPLYLAVLQRSEPVTRLLLERGAPLEQPAFVSERLASLCGTSERGQLLNQTLMMQRPHELSSKADEDAVWRSSERLWPVVSVLLEFGADPNCTDYDGNTLLTSLIEFDAPMELIRYAIEKGAAVNATESSQKTPMMLAGVEGSKVPLLLAIIKGRADLVETLLAAGADPKDGIMRENPLKMARENNRAEIVMLLEKYGASDEWRRAQEIIPRLEEMQRLWFPVPESADESRTPLSNLVMPDFSHLVGQMTEKRDKRIAERRGRLVAEIGQGESKPAG